MALGSAGTPSTPASLSSSCLCLAILEGQGYAGCNVPHYASPIMGGVSPRRAVGYGLGWSGNDRPPHLRVDDHADPVAELRRIYDLVVQHSLRIEREYGPDGLRLFSRVKC
jgi:hypothetical protein